MESRRMIALLDAIPLIDRNSRRIEEDRYQKMKAEHTPSRLSILYGQRYSHSRHVQHEAWSLWIADLKFDYFLTLTFPRDKAVSISHIYRLMRELSRRSTRKIYGNREYKTRENEIIIFFFPEEDSSGNLHIHALTHLPRGDVRTPSTSLSQVILKIWRRLTGGEINEIKRLRTDEDRWQVGRYCLKDSYFDKSKIGIAMKPKDVS